MNRVYPTQELQRLSFQITLALYRVTDFFSKTDPLTMSLRAKANDIFEGILEYAVSESREQDVMMLMHKITSVRGYLGIAREMRFLRTVNFTVLEREYERLETMLAQELEEFYATESEEKRNQRTVSRQNADGNPASAAMADRGVETRAYIPMSDNSRIKKSVMEGESHTRAAEAVPEINADHIPSLNERQKVILGYMEKTGQLKISDLFDSFTGISSKTIQRDLQSLVNLNLIKKEGDKRWTIYSVQL